MEGLNKKLKPGVYILFFELNNQTKKELFNSLRPVFGKSIPEVVSGEKGIYFDLLLSDQDFLKLKMINLKFEILVDDLEKLKEIYRVQYHSYSEVVTILRNYANSYPAIAKFESTGTSYENRWLYGVKISDNVNTDEDEPEHLFIGCTLQGNGQVLKLLYLLQIHF